MVDIPDNIIQRAAEGDPEAFERIYRAFSGFVYRVALRIASDPQDAEEIAQDVFLRIYHQLKNFRFESSLKTWVYRITINTALNARKRSARHKDKKAEYIENIETDKKNIKPNYGEKDDHQQTVNKLLNILNPDQRICIILRSIEGLSYEEIAQALGIKINTVRTRIKRAREKLLSHKHEILKP